jgi:predicted NUDIX family NTP pyrophosphohydrolase
MKQAAGTLLYRRRAGRVEVLLIHPSGAYNRKSPWGIPKGLIDEGEESESAARRETREETGVDVAGPLVPLGFIDYTRSRKRIFCFAGEAPPDAEPRCASWEVDCAEFLTLARARERIHPDQRPFLDRLEKQLAPAPSEGRRRSR